MNFDFPPEKRRTNMNARIIGLGNGMPEAGTLGKTHGYWIVAAQIRLVASWFIVCCPLPKNMLTNFLTAN